MRYIKRKIIQIRDYINAYKHFKKTIKKTSVQRIFLFSTPIHRNIGDHAIVKATLTFLEDKFKYHEVVEIPRQYINFFIKNFHVNKDDIVLIHGGGFFGNLYPVEAVAFLNVIDNYKENKIIVFPQTIYIDETKEMSYTYFEKGIKKAKNITFFAREEQSYRIAKQSGFFNSVHLVPDIVLYLNQMPVNTNKSGILLVLREDDEITRNFDLAKLEKIFKSEFQIVLEKSSTMSEYSISPNQREKAVNDKIEEFSKYNLVITDRLHGMIFSYLANTNCLAIDNKTKKSSEVYKAWLQQFENISLLDKELNEEELAYLAIKLMESQSFDKKIFDKNYFNPIFDEINNNILGNKL